MAMHWLPDFASLRIYWAAALAACIGVAISLAAFHGARLFAEDQLRADLTQQAALRARGLQEVLSHYEGTIDGFAASFRAEHVTRSDFEAYAHNVYLASHPLGSGFQNVSWLPRVRDADRARFEAAAQADGLPGYRIRDLASDDTLVPAARREEYFPIRYFDPMVSSAPLGLDVMSSGARESAAREALEKGMPIATAPLRFLSGGRGCVIYVPVFEPGSAAASLPGARGRVVGLLTFRLLISAAINSVMDALQPVPQGVDMYMLDDGAAPGDRLFYARLALRGSVTVDPDDAPNALVEPYSGSSFDFAGRDWTVIVRPTPAMLASRIAWAGWRELSIGLALTALLTAYLISSRNRADRLRVLAGSLRQEIVERERAEERIIHSARHDFLTGLPNRMLFLERLKQEIGRAKRGEKSFAVLYLDLDRFKDINDTLGHQVGDLLLKAVADRLSEGVRDIDTVARLGGDEFAVIQTGLQDATDAAILSNKLLELLHRPFRLADQDIHTDASIGTAVYTVNSGDEQATLVHADLAMYKAKAEGGGRFCFHLPEMEEEVRARAALTEELRSGIERGELALYYQPMVDLKTGTVAGIEALVRWRHPKRELLLPGIFLGEAERSGLIFELDAYVLREACRQGRAWLDSGHRACRDLRQCRECHLEARHAVSPALGGNAQGNRLPPGASRAGAGRCRLRRHAPKRIGKRSRACGGSRSSSSSTISASATRRSSICASFPSTASSSPAVSSQGWPPRRTVRRSPRRSSSSRRRSRSSSSPSASNSASRPSSCARTAAPRRRAFISARHSRRNAPQH